MREGGMRVRILITGSTGYLGSKAVDLLGKEPGVELFGIDLNSPRQASSYKVFRTGSVTDPDVMERIFDAARPDIAVHLAFAVNPLHDRAREEFIDREGTRIFLSECDRHDVGKVVVLTSVAAYGAFEDNDYPLNEKSRVRGVHGYAYSWMKAETDLMVQDYQRAHPECEVVILRPALFVGPNTHNSFFDVLKYPVVPQVREKGETRDPEFQFIHEDDMAACLAAAVLKPGLKGAYNVAGEGRVRFSELVREYGKRAIPVPRWLLKPAAKLLWWFHISKAPADQLEFLRYPWIMDNSRMKRELYTPKVDSLTAFRQFAHRNRK
jgi:nucleoside-diphosphate-sugar epimerase